MKQSRKEKLPTDWRSMEAHPVAKEFREAFDEELSRYRSTGTILPNYKDIDWDTVSKTDDMLSSCKFGSPMKEIVKAGVKGFNDITEEDPAENFNGMNWKRNRGDQTIDLYQTLFLDESEVKYPLAEGEVYPSCPMDYTKELS